MSKRKALPLFTERDVRLLRDSAMMDRYEAATRARDPHEIAELQWNAHWLDDLADRIASQLPPRSSPQGRTSATA